MERDRKRVPNKKQKELSTRSLSKVHFMAFRPGENAEAHYETPKNQKKHLAPCTLFGKRKRRRRTKLTTVRQQRDGSHAFNFVEEETRFWRWKKILKKNRFESQTCESKHLLVRMNNIKPHLLFGPKPTVSHFEESKTKCSRAPCAVVLCGRGKKAVLKINIT